MFKLALLSILLVASVSAGIVEDVIYCGGNGQNREVRISGCTTQPCQFKMGETYGFEIDFIPSRNSPRVFLDVSAYVDDDLVQLFESTFEEGLVAEESYTLNFAMSIPAGGDAYSMRLRTLIQGTNSMEICGEVDVDIVH
jgi:hypothetical protein